MSIFRDRLESIHTCPLCGKGSHPVETFHLYDLQVCADCRAAFSRRRQAAFATDLLLYVAVGNALALLYHLLFGVEMHKYLAVASFVVFLLKDGFRGMSPGKWLFDVQVLDENTRWPAGFWASFKRNLPILVLSWIAIILIVIDLPRGRRWGDRWANTMVIWRRYADRMPLEPFTRCRKCAYDLTGNVSGICPECSTPIPKHDQEALAAKGLNAAYTYE